MNKYETAWYLLRDRLKATSEIHSFHGLQFKPKDTIAVSDVLSWMDAALKAAEKRVKEDK